MLFSVKPQHESAIGIHITPSFLNSLNYFFFHAEKDRTPQIWDAMWKAKSYILLCIFIAVYVSNISMANMSYEIDTEETKDEVTQEFTLKRFTKGSYSSHAHIFALCLNTVVEKRLECLGNHAFRAGLLFAATGCFCRLSCPMPAAQILHSVHYFSPFFKNIFLK